MSSCFLQTPQQQRLKHADVIDAGVERIEQYMEKLVESVDQMHEEIVDAELQRARK